MVENGKPTVTDVLMPERQVHGFTIRPWTWRETKQLGPVLHAMVKEAQKLGIDDKNLRERYKELAEPLAPFADEVVAKLVKQDVDYVNDKMPGGLVTLLFLHTIDMNLDYIKNLFGLSIPPIPLPGMSGWLGPSSSSSLEDTD
jgi:hypothetical protein